MMRAPRLPPDGSAREVDDDAFVDAAAWDSARDADAMMQTSLALLRQVTATSPGFPLRRRGSRFAAGLQQEWLPPVVSAHGMGGDVGAVAAAWGSARDVGVALAPPLARDRECCSMRLTPRLQLE